MDALSEKQKREEEGGLCYECSFDGPLGCKLKTCANHLFSLAAGDDKDVRKELKFLMES